MNRREMMKVSAAAGVGALIGPGCAKTAAVIGSPPSSDAGGGASIKTRMFWTWDHSTEWSLNLPGAHTIGSCNSYDRTTEAFLNDYTALLRWCSLHAIDAVVVWGLLRDAHGGLDAAKRLCDVAANEGVKLLCGVGLNTYGGVYYEGASPYNLEMHLQAHPELYAFDENGDSINFSMDSVGNRSRLGNTSVPGPRGFYHACPSRPENQEFVAESLVWLFKNLPLGGVQIETGDTGVCRCQLCRDRRKYPVSSFSWEDMALMYAIAANAIRSVAPDAWIVCETYSHPQPSSRPQNEAPGFGHGKPAWADDALAAFPRGVFVQWVADRYLREGDPTLVWNAEGRVSGDGLRHVMRAHFGTDWGWGGFRGELAIEWISRLVQMSIAAGIDTISMFGEVSPFLTGAELNYLALADFGGAYNPAADGGAFQVRIASQVLGGENNAREFVRFAGLLDARDPSLRQQIPAALSSIYGRLASLSPDAAAMVLAGKRAGILRPILKVPAEKTFIDFSGDGIDVVNPLTGECHKAVFFVAVLGASTSPTWSRSCTRTCRRGSAATFAVATANSGQFARLTPLGPASARNKLASFRVGRHTRANVLLGIVP